MNRSTAREMAIIDLGYEPKHYEGDYKSFVAAIADYENDLLGHRAEKRLNTKFRDGKGKRTRNRQATKHKQSDQSARRPSTTLRTYRVHG